jgi:hypothetical protein
VRCISILWLALLGSVADATEPVVCRATAGGNRVAIEERQRQIREFVLFSYRSIAAELLRGGGTYLDNLHALFEVNVSDKSAFNEKLKTRLLATSSIPDFAVETSSSFSCSRSPTLNLRGDL